MIHASKARWSQLWIREINSIIGNQQLPIPDATLRIPAIIKEQISEEFGGLMQFAKAHPLEYAIGQQGKVLTIRRILPKSTDVKRSLIIDVGGRPVVLPHFAVPVPTLANVAKASPYDTAKGLLPLLSRKEVALVAYPERLDINPVPWSFCVVPNEKVVKPTSSSSLDPAYAPFVVEEFNICRSSRFLNCDDFTPIETWMKSLVGIVTQHPALIALADSNRFEIKFISQTPVPTNKSEEDFLSVLSKEGININSPQGVKYVVSEEGIGEAKISEKYEHSTIEELEAEMRNLHNSKKDKGFKVIKERRRIIKALLRKRFPNGSPLWDPDVTAYLVYDLMQPLSPGFHRTMKIRELLPEGGRVCCSTNNDFFERFPHLFHCDELSRTDMVVMRADGGDKPVKKDLSDVEVLLGLATALPHPIQPGRAFSASHLAGKLTAHVIAHIKRVWGSPTEVLKSFPDTFQTVGEDMFLSTDTKVEKWLSELRAQK